MLASILISSTFKRRFNEYSQIPQLLYFLSLALGRRDSFYCAR